MERSEKSDWKFTWDKQDGHCLCYFVVTVAAAVANAWEEQPRERRVGFHSQCEGLVHGGGKAWWWECEMAGPVTSAV